MQQKPTNVRSLLKLIGEVGSGALKKRMHPAVTLSFTLFAAAAFGSGVMYQIYSEPVPVVGKVLGQEVSAPEFVRLVNNGSLKLTAQVAVAGDATDSYTFTWSRVRDQAGSLYISPYTNARTVTYSVDPAPRSGSSTSGSVFTVGQRYRADFYRLPNKKGGLLARKFFVVPKYEAIAMCDYAAPPVGCTYEQGPNYNARTSCGLELKCTATSSPVFCTTDAKVCPDGSSVGRSGPRCEFAACPTPATSTKPACMPRPACLDSTQAIRCTIPEPASGWCEQPATEVTVLYPNGGERLERNKDIEIKWRANGAVDIYLVDPRVVCITAPCNAGLTKIAENVSGGVYHWVVPESVSSTTRNGTVVNAESTYRIRVVGRGPVACTASEPPHCSNASDESDAVFTVQNFGVMCNVLCAAPPTGCHYVSDGKSCSCGVLACEDTTR